MDEAGHSSPPSSHYSLGVSSDQPPTGDPTILGSSGRSESSQRSSKGKQRPDSGVSMSAIFPPFDPRFSVSSPVAFPTDEDGRKRLVILGSGDFGLALLTRLSEANYNVVVGSRHPQRTRERVHAAGGRIMTQEEALQHSSVVVLAIPMQHFSSLPLASLDGKILIEISNRTKKERREKQRSQAERVQELVPSAAVVKALNVLSAYTLSRGIRGSKEVPVCGDDEAARALVSTMVRDLGFDPIDRGRLSNARQVEMIPFAFFTEWRLAFVVSTVVWLIFFCLTVFEWQLCDNIRAVNNPNATPDWSSFSDIAVGNVSVASASTALTLLAACYLSGVVAAYLQLVRGTKYSEFPGWLDRWLLSRKYLGLLAALEAFLHAFYQLSRGALVGQPEGWRKFTFVACGIWAVMLLGILTVTSLPSVASSLTWREFSFVQSRLGWATLFFATFHILFMGWDKLFKPNFTCYLPSIGQVVMVLPLVTLALKLPLLLPCIDKHLTNIRQGYERNPVTHTV